MNETITRLTMSDYPLVCDAPTMAPQSQSKPRLSLEISMPCFDADQQDNDFILNLAYRALEHEANSCKTAVARSQVAFLLDRLIELDWRE